MLAAQQLFDVAREQLPTRIQTTFGGAPCRNARLLKSPSLDTMIKSCCRAYSQTTASSAVARPTVNEIRIDIAEPIAQVWRKVVVEQQLHLLPIATSRRSRSAANGEAGPNIVFGQIGKISEHLVL